MTKILFADDEPWYTGATFSALRDRGYDVSPVEDGTEVLEHLESEGEPDLIILDIRMPAGRRVKDPTQGRETGVRVGEILRDQRYARPIIYLTVVSDPVVHEEIARIEELAHMEQPHIMVKPVLPSEVVDMVVDLIGEPD